MNTERMPHPIDTQIQRPLLGRWWGYATIIAADIGSILTAMVIALGVSIDALAFF